MFVEGQKLVLLKKKIWRKLNIVNFENNFKQNEKPTSTFVIFTKGLYLSELQLMNLHF